MVGQLEALVHSVLTAEPRSTEQPLSYTLLPLAMAAGNMMNCAKSLELSACIPLAKASFLALPTLKWEEGSSIPSWLDRRRRKENLEDNQRKMTHHT